MIKFAPSYLHHWRQIICHFSAVLSLPLCAWADDAPLRILSPSQGGGVSQQSLNIEYSYDPAIFGKAPEVDVKIDGLDATITRGMAVKGTAPTQAPVDDSQPSMQADSKSIQIPPQDCEVTIVAIGLDGKKHTSTVRVKWTGTVAKVKKQGRLLVLAIGVSQYQDETIQDLQLAAKDARDFAALVEAQKGGFYTDAEVRTLVDEQVIQDNILDELDALKQKAKDEDTAFIFIAGHGVSDGESFYFVPHDANDEKVRRTCVDFDEFQGCARSLKSRTVVFMDTCHSGGISGGGEISSHITKLLTGWQNAPSANGAVIFTSSTGAQVSHENLEWQNGAFTKALLEGLRGDANPAKAGPISASMLDSYLAKKVSEITDGKQTPTSSKSANTTDFDFFLAGDAKLEKALLEEEAFKKEARDRVVHAVRVAFIAQQVLMQRQKQIKDLEEVNSDGSFDEKIEEYKSEVTNKNEELSESLYTLNEVPDRHKTIVASAIAERERELAASLKSATKKTAEVAVSAMNALKEKVKLPESY